LSKDIKRKVLKKRVDGFYMISNLFQIDMMNDQFVVLALKQPNIEYKILDKLYLLWEKEKELNQLKNCI
jgi:hypothetical protein